jgi:hypothetical protein
MPKWFLAPLTTTCSYDCNDSDTQRWFLSFGSTKVVLAGTNFCLDAGSSKCAAEKSELGLLCTTDPASGTALKIWECYDDLPAQQWFFTDDLRLALEETGEIILHCSNGKILACSSIF